MARILIAEDDAGTLDTVRACLAAEGHQVQAFPLGSEALAAIPAGAPELLVLDVMLPDIDGFEICALLRADARQPRMPILLLTSRATLQDKEAGFAAGADDYLTKPFELNELRWRVRALLRRANQGAQPAPPAPPLTGGGLALDVRSCRVIVRGRSIRLRPLEGEILRYLMQHPDQAVSNERLLQDVFGYPPGVGNTSGLRTHIMNLRDKIENKRSRQPLIATVTGKGYLFDSRAGKSRA